MRANTVKTRNKTRKEMYIDSMAAQLKGWSLKIDELETRAAGTAVGIKAGYTARIRDLKQKRRQLAAKLREAKRSGGKAWTAIRSGIDAAKHDLSKAVRNARDTFRKAA